MTRIVCCGNRDRGDDAAGVLVAEHLKQFGVDVELFEGDPLAILEKWAPADEVIVVDAMITGAPVGTVRVWDESLGAKLCGGWASTHGLGVGEAIQLAEILGKLPRRLRVYGIEAKQFRAGAGVSQEVERAAQAIARQIASARRHKPSSHHLP